MMNNRIAKIIGCGLLFLSGISAADAQPLTDGRVSVHNLSVSLANGKVFIAMDVDVSALNV